MKLPVATQERFQRATGVRLVEGYGTTETSPATHANPVGDGNRPGTVGVPLPGTDARIIDGELAVRGPQVFAGYWADADGADGRTEGGWFLTGDLAEMDDDGYFTIVGRKKDLIIAGGFNIYPGEVEEVIAQLDGVAECVVVGLPDRYRGETVKAYVVRRPDVELDERAVTAHCERHLSAYKVPKLVEFRAELPRSAVGKALRRVLVDEELATREQQA
jgi:long-chain acyl-CoA synthetase